MKLLRPIIVTSVAFVCTTAAAPVAAQDVQYETVTKLELPGALGTMMRAAARLGGGSTETVEKTFIKGNRMRTDVDRQSTIMDLDGRRVISIDHEAKTYSIFTFDQMIARAKEASEALQAEAGKRQVSENPQAQGQVNFRFAVDDGKQRERIAGYNADLFFITMEAEGEYVPEGAQPGAQREKGGTFVVLTELWASKDMPAAHSRLAFDQASAREYANASAAVMQGMAAAFADDPQIRVAFEQSAREAMKIEGMAVKSVTRMVSVAPEQKFDRELALGRKQEGPGVGAQAARAGLGRLARAAAGAAGRQADQQQQQQEQQEVTQATFLTVTSEVRNVSTRALDPKLFEPPAGYRQVELQ